MFQTGDTAGLGQRRLVGLFTNGLGNLQRDGPAELIVPGAPHLAGASLAQDPFQPVPSGKNAVRLQPIRSRRDRPQVGFGIQGPVQPLGRAQRRPFPREFHEQTRLAVAQFHGRGFFPPFQHFLGREQQLGNGLMLGWCQIAPAHDEPPRTSGTGRFASAFLKYERKRPKGTRPRFAPVPRRK